MGFRRDIENVVGASCPYRDRKLRRFTFEVSERSCLDKISVFDTFIFPRRQTTLIMAEKAQKKGWQQLKNCPNRVVAEFDYEPILDRMKIVILQE
mgnify:CR=1 FL=1